MSIPRTERRNPNSMNLDRMSTEEMAKLVITANYDAVKAAESASEAIAKAVEAVAEAFNSGGHLFYIGAGTSGRLGIIDAAEAPPTFGVPHDLIQGIIAGGYDRLVKAGENEEDNYEKGCEEMRARGVTSRDVVVGISAAGNAAYVVGALEEAKRRGCVTVAISSNEDTAVLRCADIPIFTDTGAEVLTGSTRLKAGTAQKIVLNTISTCAMVKVGKVYENMMINLAPSNVKLKRRVIRITSAILECSEDEAQKHLNEHGWVIRDTVEAVKKRS